MGLEQAEFAQRVGWWRNKSNCLTESSADLYHGNEKEVWNWPLDIESKSISRLLIQRVL